MTVLEQAAEDNKVFTRWAYEGTHRRALHGQAGNRQLDPA